MHDQHQPLNITPLSSVVTRPSASPLVVPSLRTQRLSSPDPVTRRFLLPLLSGTLTTSVKCHFRNLGPFVDPIF